jgi:hypothetical protein
MFFRHKRRIPTFQNMQHQPHAASVIFQENEHTIYALIKAHSGTNAHPLFPSKRTDIGEFETIVKVISVQMK